MRLLEALNALATITGDQWGMTTTAQAEKAGVGRVTLLRLVRAGHLDTVRRGVYALAAAGEPPHQSEKAAWLALNPTVLAWERPRLDPNGGVVSHRSAARFHELGDMRTEVIELIVPRAHKARDPELRLRTRTDISEDDITVLDGLPVTTVERTIRDLLADHADASDIGDIIASALQRDLVDPESLAERIAPYARRSGIRPRSGAALITALISQVRGPEYGRAARRRAVAVSMPAETSEQAAELADEFARHYGRLTYGQLADSTAATRKTREPINAPAREVAAQSAASLRATIEQINAPVLEAWRHAAGQGETVAVADLITVLNRLPMLDALTALEQSTPVPRDSPHSEIADAHGLNSQQTVDP